jgi:carboxylesterase type B
MQIFNMPAPKESEDCLYLNVWAPLEPPPPGGFPVLFWIYGGNLQFGATALDLYQGQNIAKNQKVVVVSTNYRTNGKMNSRAFPYCVY